MSLITEQIKALKNHADYMQEIGHLFTASIIRHAADTIEQLAAKVRATNMERSTAYYNGGWIPVKERLPERAKSYLVSGGGKVWICQFLDFGAIKSLEQEPCPDTIGRSDMLDAVGHGATYTSEDLQKIINDLPSVNPVKTGHWKYYQNEKGDWINECSVCGSDAGVGYQYPYCPNCGAKMVEPQESEGTDADSD